MRPYQDMLFERLLLNSSSSQIDIISYLGLVSTLLARQHKVTASKIFSTRENFPVVRSIADVFESGL